MKESQRLVRLSVRAAYSPVSRLFPHRCQPHGQSTCRLAWFARASWLAVRSRLATRLRLLFFFAIFAADPRAVQFSERRLSVEQTQNLLPTKIRIGSQPRINRPDKFQITRLVNGPTQVVQGTPQLALDIAQAKAPRGAQIGSDMLSIRFTASSVPGAFQCGSGKYFGIEPVGISANESIRGIVAVAGEVSRDNPVDDFGFEQWALGGRADSLAASARARDETVSIPNTGTAWLRSPGFLPPPVKTAIR